MLNTNNLCKFLAVLFVVLFFCGCGSKVEKPQPDKLASIQIIDKNNVTEVISSSKRLKNYQNVNFLAPQTYSKVMRNYGEDERGQKRSYITSYYPNGQVKKYLEVINSRAFGKYKEWHSNGQLSIDCNIIGGRADVTPEAEKSWIFDGMSFAWDESGKTVAKLKYNKGVQEGVSLYYHTNGKIWKKAPFHRGKLDGILEVYFEDGHVFSRIGYKNGEKDGESKRFWSKDVIASKENYKNGLLINGEYFDKKNVLSSKIVDGSGMQPIFDKDNIHSLVEYKSGRQDGVIKVFSSSGKVERQYRAKDFVKHGEEIFFYSHKLSQPKISINWHNGNIQGLVSTWYDNGSPESRKEMSNNKKNGISTSWYHDGTLMMIEEYENDTIVQGDYFKKGEKKAVSNIYKGRGTATIFDAEGGFVKKISYKNGVPL